MSCLETARQALASIPDWSGPDVTIEPLAGGLRNDSFRIRRGADAAVLRLPGPDADTDARDFELERKIQTRAAERGLAACVLHADTTSGVLISEYLPGHSLTDSDLHDSRRLVALAELLRRVHELPRCGVPFRALDAASRYLAALGQEHPQSAFAARCLDIVRNVATGSTACCCHNDVVANNVIEGDDLRLIDWEYACDNDPFFDLASIVGWHDLDAARAETLLRAYVGRVGSEASEHLEFHCRRYDAIQWLWLAERQQRFYTEQQAARLELVRKRLLVSATSRSATP